MAQAKKGLTREQAQELYRDLQKTLNQMKSQEAVGQGVAQNSRPQSAARASLMNHAKRASFPKITLPLGGQNLAIALVVILGLAKVGLGVIEATGVSAPAIASASVASSGMAKMVDNSKFSKEEVELLGQLDVRRAQLEERNEKLSDRERDIEKREIELASRLTEIKTLTDELRIKREQTDRRRDGQLDQLSKVYSSMAPEEAAKLMEQLDITISLSLLKRMPEKRIAQVLALMSSERALTLTQMLSQ